MNQLVFSGKIIAALPVRTGTSQKGDWSSQSFVVESQETYPKKMCFDIFGSDRIGRIAPKIGDVVDIYFEIDAHEYQGRWFNSVRAWDVRPHEDAPVVATTSDDKPKEVSDVKEAEGDKDSLPF